MVVDRREGLSAGDDDALDRVLSVVRLLAQDPAASALVGPRVVERRRRCRPRSGRLGGELSFRAAPVRFLLQVNRLVYRPR